MDIGVVGDLSGRGSFGRRPERGHIRARTDTPETVADLSSRYRLSRNLFSIPSPMERIEVISHTVYSCSMRVTLSIPDPIARRFRAAVPPRQRSRLVTGLIEQELARRDDALAAACQAANSDPALEKEIDQWQAFDDEFEG